MESMNQPFPGTGSNPWEFKLLRENIKELEEENYGILLDRGTTRDYPLEESTRELSEQFGLLSVQLQLQGLNHPNTATIHNCIARQYIKMREYEKALSAFMIAKDIREDVLGTDHPDTAACYNFIAGAHYLLEEYDEAVSWLLKELAIKEKELGKGHPDIGPSYAIVSKLYALAGRRDKAREWQLRVS